MPAAMFAFPLTVESDGRMLAQRALAGGAKTVDVIAGDSLLMKRFAGAFAIAWSEGGGRVPDAFRFDPAPEALTGLRRTLGQTTPDAVLLAVNGDRAALLKPFIGGVRAYASGLVFERPPQAVARDLDDVRVVEIPWLLTPNAAEFNGLAAPRFRQRGARAPLRARPRRFSRRGGVQGRTAGALRARRRNRPRFACARTTVRSRREARRLSQRRARPARICALIVRGAAAGARAEALAADYLMRQGLTIVGRNFRTRFGEIDLIAQRRLARSCSSKCGCAARRASAARSKASRRRSARGWSRRRAAISRRSAREPACRFDAILMQRLDAACIDWRRDIVDVE